MSLEQQYYNMLARLDHPVFKRDFSDTTTINKNSPLNSVINLVIAKRLVAARATFDDIQLNADPSTATDMGIDQWEETYFGFVKSGKSLAERIAELLIKINKKFTMSVPDVIALAQAITGQTPTVVRQMGKAGWVLGTGILGRTTILSGVSAESTFRYLVIFSDSVDSTLRALLDAQLTSIEKGGSTHLIIAPRRHWILGRGVLGVDTTLG